MEQQDLLKRAADLADRCERSSIVTSTGFLTPAEQYALRQWADRQPGLTVLFHGGGEGCERQCAFFLPYWLPPEDYQPDEYIRAVRSEAHFGEPGHRDYMGAALALGLKREWLGDFVVDGATAYIFCLPSVEPVLTEELTRAGRVTVRTVSCCLEDVPAREKKTRRVSFTVKSARLDAVISGMFGMSRTSAADQIRLGAATLNYAVCDRVDAPVKPGDVISLRGKGKGSLTGAGGRSRKDRLFLEAEILL